MDWEQDINVVCCPRCNHSFSFPGRGLSLSPVSAERLRNTYHITDAETRDIAKMLPDAQKYLATLTRHLKEVEKTISDNYSLITPILRFPKSVLQLIFSFCCEPEELRGAGKMIRMSTKSETMPSLDALRLSHVCASWREMVISIPSLWTDISLCLQDDVEYMPEELDHYRDIVRLYLNCSKKQPLSVQLRFPLGTDLRDYIVGDEIGSFQFEWHRKMLENIIGEWIRLRQIYLGMCRYSLNYLAWTRPNLFPELRTVAIDCFRDGEYLGPDHDLDEDDKLLSLPFDSSPQLRALFLNDCPIAFSQGFTPRIPRLSYLELTGTSSNILVPLSWVSEDCEAVVKDIPDDGVDIEGMGDVEFMRCGAGWLTFEISSEPQFSPAIFPRLIFEASNGIRFIVSYDNSDFDLADIPPFPMSAFDQAISYREPDSSNPKALELIRLSVTDWELIEILARMITIESLTVHDRELPAMHPSLNQQPPHPLLSDYFFEALHASHPLPILHLLRSLTLKFTFRFEELEEDVLGMIESRCPAPEEKGIKTLHSIVLYVPKDTQVSKRFSKRVSALKKKGLSFLMQFNSV